MLYNIQHIEKPATIMIILTAYHNHPNRCMAYIIMSKQKTSKQINTYFVTFVYYLLTLVIESLP